MTRPAPSNAIPFASVSQRTPFGGKGLNGHSVAARTASNRNACRRVPSIFFSRAAANCYSPLLPKSALPTKNYRCLPFVYLDRQGVRVPEKSKGLML